MVTIEEADEGVICETSSEVGKGRRMRGFRRASLRKLGSCAKVGWLGMNTGGMGEGGTEGVEKIGEAGRACVVG